MKAIKFLQVIFLFTLSTCLFAQLPDLTDPFFDPYEAILTPKQVKEHHVRSCLEKGQLGDTRVFYDGNGRPIKSREDKTFFIYDGFENILTGHIFEEKTYADIFKYAGNYTIEYDSASRLSRINYQYQSGDYTKEQSATQIHYEEGKLYAYQKVGRYEGISDKDIDNKTFFEYDENGGIKEVREMIEETGIEVTLYYQYSDNKLIMKEDALHVNKYLYGPDGKLTGIDCVAAVMYNMVSGDASKFEPKIRYEYNDHGLMSKKTDHLWSSEDTYEYDYISPANVTVKAEGGLESVSLYNYSQQYGYERYNLINGEAEFALYPPYKELYVLEITPEFVLPVIITPGKAAAIYITTDDIIFGDGDEDNVTMFEVEMAKMQAIDPNLTEEENVVNIASIIVEKMGKYPEFIGFLFYANFWDIQNNKQLFLDYTEKMLELYPMNFKACEAFVSLRQD